MSTCPENPPAPDGFRIWRGPVPRPLSQWAIDQRDHWMPAVRYGDTVGIDYADPVTGASQSVVARKDHHTWTYKNGRLLTGLCIPGITLYQSKLTPALAGPPGVGAGATGADDLSTPDPSVAAFTNEPGTNWGLVGWSALAALGIVGAFVAGIHFAGRHS